MKRIFLVLIVICFIPLTCFAKPSLQGESIGGELYNFSNNMTMEDVFKIEKNPVHNSTDESITFTGKILDFESFIIYTFKDGKLFRKIYYFDENDNSVQDTVIKFMKLSSGLESILGEPEEVNGTYTNEHDCGEVKEDNPNIGCMAFISKWKTNSQKAILILTGGLNQLDNFYLELRLTEP